MPCLFERKKRQKKVKKTFDMGYATHYIALQITLWLDDDMSKKRSETIRVCCDCDLMAKVKRLARRNNIAVAELIRRCIAAKLPDYETRLSGDNKQQESDN